MTVITNDLVAGVFCVKIHDRFRENMGLNRFWTHQALTTLEHTKEN